MWAWEKSIKSTQKVPVNSRQKVPSWSPPRPIQVQSWGDFHIWTWCRSPGNGCWQQTTEGNGSQVVVVFNIRRLQILCDICPILISFRGVSVSFLSGQAPLRSSTAGSFFTRRTISTTRIVHRWDIDSLQITWNSFGHKRQIKLIIFRGWGIF